MIKISTAKVSTAIAKSKRVANSTSRVITAFVRPGKLLLVTLRLAKTAIKFRTAQGRDVNEMAFNKYTPKYRAWKAAQGKNASVVNLNFDGNMMGAVATKKLSPLTGQIFVRANPVARSKISTQRLAKVHHEGLGNQKRPRLFFAWKKGTVTDSKLKKKVAALAIQDVRRRARGANIGWGRGFKKR